MNPQEIQRKIDELQRQIDALKSNTTIPFEVGEAFRDRLGVKDFTSLAVSSKNPSTETQAVNEAGSSSYNVAKPMDGFREFNSGGTIIYIPYYL